MYKFIIRWSTVTLNCITSIGSGLSYIQVVPIHCYAAVRKILTDTCMASRGPSAVAELFVDHSRCLDVSLSGSSDDTEDSTGRCRLKHHIIRDYSVPRTDRLAFTLTFPSDQKMIDITDIS